MIQTETCSLKGIEAVGHSLDMLVVIGCGLTKIESCVNKLVRLRKLFLQENKITQIENLSDCCHLEQLSLFSNKILEVDNLDSNVMLRELNLADNRIKKLNNLSRLINLHTLDLSGNPIKSFSEIDQLKELPMIEQLSFGSPLFEACPITSLPDYKSHIQKTIGSLRLLDGVKLSFDNDTHREYVRLVEQMNVNISEMECNQERKLLQLDSELKVNEDALNGLRDMCVKQLEDVKETIETGRKRIESEQLQMQHLRKVNEKKLVEDLKEILDQYKKKLNEVIKDEENKLVDENIMWNNKLEEVNFEKAVYETLINVMFSTNGKILYAELEGDSPEFSLIQSLFSKVKSKSVSILSACLIHNENNKPNDDKKIFSYAQIDLSVLESFLKNKTHINTTNSLDDCLKDIESNSIIAIYKDTIHSLAIITVNKKQPKTNKDPRLNILITSPTVYSIIKKSRN